MEIERKGMKGLLKLLAITKSITLQDISILPIENQHFVALRLEQLQDELIKAMNSDFHRDIKDNDNVLTLH